MKIQSRPIDTSDPCASSWPPLEPANEPGLYHWDVETQTFKWGPPPNPHPKFADAPSIIIDTIEPYRHPGGECWVDSKSRLRDLDKACGTITTDKPIAADPSWQKEQATARRKDLHDAMHKAVAQVDAGTAPLSEEVRAQCERTNQIISSNTGMDAFNVAGRKNNAKGKRFRRRK